MAESVLGPNGPVDGYNMIMMDDRAGEELIGIRGQRDVSLVALRNTDINVGEHQTSGIGGNNLGVVGGDESREVTGAFGLKAKGIALDSGAGVSIRAKGDMTLETGETRLDQKRARYTRSTRRPSSSSRAARSISRRRASRWWPRASRCSPEDRRSK